MYVTLETGWVTSRIMPVDVDPRCPRLVRELIQLPGSWYHGTSVLRSKIQVAGFDAGEGLAAEIEHLGRAVPLVVISTISGAAIVPGMDATVAYDLVGLANVVVIDEDASWALTDVLGSSLSCYAGAVRLYWPHFSRQQDPFLHPLWTGDRLRLFGADALDTRERFRKYLRANMFKASALSITRPREIDDIRDAADQATVLALRARATSLEEFREYADIYAAENAQLRTERIELRSQVEVLQEQVGKLEVDREALVAHLQAAKGWTAGGTPGSEGDLSPEDVSVDSLPRSGEVRYYKKIHSRQTHDVMKRVADCGCNSWSRLNHWCSMCSTL